MGTIIEKHFSGTQIKKINLQPIELRRPSILRASGHTFEYLGFGPGNYSTALPQVQVRTLSEREEFLVQSQERSCGTVVYTGMNNRGDFYIGNKRVTSTTGEETTFDAPTPTVTGQDPSRLSVIFDEVVVKERIIIEGGKSNRVLSQFDGPVTFNSDLRLSDNTKQLITEAEIRAQDAKFRDTTNSTAVTNGAVVTINGASNFTYDLGGNATSGVTGSSNTLSAFAATMGVATLPTSGSTAGSSDVSISNNGLSSTSSPTFTVTKSASKISEGEAVTFTITASSAVSADTSFSWSAMGDTNGSTVTAASNSDISVLSGSATIAAGGTTATFDVGAVTDSTVEGLEGVKVSVFDSNAAAVASNVVLFDNAGSAATTQSFTGTTGVNNFTGGDGNDSFDFSTAASFQDIDALDGGAGTDTLTVSYAAAATLKPDVENIEKVVITNSAASGQTLTINAVDTASGYSHITNLSSTGHLTINNLQNLPTLVTMNNAGDNTNPWNISLYSLYSILTPAFSSVFIATLLELINSIRESVSSGNADNGTRIFFDEVIILLSTIGIISPSLFLSG